jgi:hypothetical protein
LQFAWSDDSSVSLATAEEEEARELPHWQLAGDVDHDRRERYDAARRGVHHVKYGKNAVRRIRRFLTAVMR